MNVTLHKLLHLWYFFSCQLFYQHVSCSLASHMITSWMSGKSTMRPTLDGSSENSLIAQDINFVLLSSVIPFFQKFVKVSDLSANLVMYCE